MVDGPEAPDSAGGTETGDGRNPGSVAAEAPVKLQESIYATESSIPVDEPERRPDGGAY